VNGSPDPEKWNFEHGFVCNRELQWYQRENAYCKGGVLIIGPGGNPSGAKFPMISEVDYVRAYRCFQAPAGK
jgi:hypothetical protein